MHMTEDYKNVSTTQLNSIFKSNIVSFCRLVDIILFCLDILMLSTHHDLLYILIKP